VFRFVAPNANELLQELANRIRAIPDDRQRSLMMNYSERIHNRLATLRSDNSARGACADIAAEADAEIARLRTALRFYARGDHYSTDEADEFDTVSGEPQNWLCSGRDDCTTMFEDGQVARFALRGEQINWIDGDDDTTPQPIDGER
jgi:hypothetical protein